ncbi:MAG: hypothetical protein K9M11_04815 [Candidatus Pacebacteria bacterium]|nr:hypothetical protein [Candidatus Paceibacterota bacterium]
MISKKTSLIIIILVVSLFVGGLIGFYFYTKNKNPGSTILGGQVNRGNFGGYDPNNPNSNNNNNGTSSPIINTGTISEVKIPKLRQISDVPTAGTDFISTPIYEETNKNVEPADLSASNSKKVVQKQPKIIDTKVTIRYIERGTGHIYETATSTLEKTRISNTTTPKIYEAYFTDKGDNLILRGLIGSSDIVSTQYASLVLASTSEGEVKNLEVKDLPIQMSQIAISPSKTQLFSIMETGVRGLLSKIDGGSTVGIFDTPYREWIPSWPQEKNITLTTKASGFAPGFSYILNTQNKQITRVLGNIYGLTTLTSPNLSKVIYSASEKGTFSLNYLDRTSDIATNITLTTLPEKCIWSKLEESVIFCAVPENIAFSTYPDVWYQGLINFSDSIWKIDVDTGESRLIMNIQEEAGDVIDVTNLYLSPSEDYLVFTNKADLTLWGLQLVEPVKKFEINPLDSINSTSTSSTTSN